MRSERVPKARRRSAQAGLDFLDAVREADADSAHKALSRYAVSFGFSRTESWLIDPSADGAARLRERRTLIPEAEAGILYLLDRGDPAFAWAAGQGRPWLMHPRYQLPLPDESEASDAIRASEEIAPSRMNFAIPGASGISLTSMSSDMSLRDLEAALRRHSIAFALACYAVSARKGASTPGVDRAVLTPRERECLTFLAAGMRNARIAWRLSVTESTVEMHLANARRKLGAQTREQALVEALRLGLISP